MTRARKTSALLVAGLLAVAGCGGSEGGAASAPVSAAASPPAPPVANDDPAKITQLARSVVLADSGRDLCRERFSARFVTTVFGSAAACEGAWRPDPADHKTQEATVSDIRVSGLAATATVTEVGGEWDGARGTWGFIRVGEDWRVAAWSVDYLRSAFRASFGPAQRSADPGNLFSDLAVLGCVSDKVQRPEDVAFTRWAYRMLRSDARAAKALNNHLRSCALVRGTDGLTPLRRSFEAGVRRGAERGGTAQLAGCMTRRLRTAITDRDLGRVFDTFLASGEYPPAIQRRARDAALDCALKKT
ncbi:MAG TPA: hypothetical protein VMZ00_03210 [Sporichthya sp.]|nr:hypothetical protein [Sporichthya sp.]